MSDILIQVKRTDVSGRTPNTTNVANLQYIAEGELALNMADRRLFSSNGSVLIEVGANLTSLNVTGGTTVNGALLVNNTATINIVSTPKITLTGNTSQTIETISNTVSAWQYSNSLSVSAQETEPRDIFFSNTGTTLFVLGNNGDDITSYTLGTAWDITTAVANTTFSLAGQDLEPIGFYFKPDGLTFYVVGNTNDSVYRYDMSSAWNISTAVSNNSFSVAAQESSPQSISFSSNGSIMYVAGSTGDDITWYNLSTPWAITTAVANSQFSLNAFETSPEGIYFSDDGSTLWVVGSTFIRLIQYTLSTPWDLNTATLSDISSVYHSTFNNTTRYITNGTSGIFVNPAVNKAWIIEYNNDRIHEFVTDIPATRFVGSNLVADKDINFKRNVRIQEGLEVARTAYFINAVTGVTSFSSPTFNPISSSATFSLGTGTTSGTFNFATGLTSGAFTMGGTSQTGAMVIGRSTANATINIHSGATVSTNIKILNLATGGLSGSITNVAIGSSTSGATTNTVLYSNSFVVTGGNTHLGGLIGGESLRVTPTTNSNNYLQIAGSITGSSPTLSAQGVDTNIGITLAAKGSGVVNVNALLNVVSSLQVNSTFVANSTMIKILANDILTFNDNTTQNTAFRVYNESGTRIA